MYYIRRSLFDNPSKGWMNFILLISHPYDSKRISSFMYSCFVGRTTEKCPWEWNTIFGTYIVTYSYSPFHLQREISLKYPAHSRLYRAMALSRYHPTLFWILLSRVVESRIAPNSCSAIGQGNSSVPSAIFCVHCICFHLLRSPSIHSLNPIHPSPTSIFVYLPRNFASILTYCPFVQMTTSLAFSLTALMILTACMISYSRAFGYLPSIGNSWVATGVISCVSGNIYPSDSFVLGALVENPTTHSQLFATRFCMCTPNDIALSTHVSVSASITPFGEAVIVYSPWRAMMISWVGIWKKLKNI